MLMLVYKLIFLNQIPLYILTGKCLSRSLHGTLSTDITISPTSLKLEKLNIQPGHLHFPGPITTQRL